MSTPITLTVGDIELTYNTTYMGIDHGMLFQELDRKCRRHKYINYEYYEQHPDEDVSQSEMCFCRPLRSLIPRLELLGYTLPAVKAEYDRLAMQDHEQRLDTEAPERTDTSGLLDFDQFVAFIRTYAVSKLSDEYNADYDEEHRAKRGFFSHEAAIEQLPAGALYRETGGYSERSHFGNLLGFLSPYSTLRVLAENPENLDLEVVWDYGKFVSAGWAQNSDFVAGARRTQTYLIATEGSSDTHILKRAIALLLPEVQDFFKFMEVADRHPFSGTGNLAKFAEGLVKIDVHNRVVFLFDNDAEGHDAFRSLQRFNFPVNMCAMVLPDLEELRSFPARGPDGVSNADLNGRAAAIECYLDLRLKDRNPPQVTWTNYKEKLDVYQGSLDFKESYADAFYKASAEAIAANEYDVSKLRIVLGALLRQCSQMAEQMHSVE
ncbi:MULTISPECIES: HEPN/Toprim-associated domain-containing protein [Pseudomonadaceae]|uniref:HEPN/Toprim N-terminal domain-containing protein n=2 Tax=Stutzerimonas stutzeri subgroup TaxID=578833 RepID=L0GJG1_STUST|nr:MULTISPECIES: HEPN/Toprim-associated domain-containing protein [Pseudomonadaceae]AGA85515.1 hypothetical protein Psest_0936 [Stutzerimonas stutzeri RCH2]MBX7270395.1 hypothetical protein [Stutzerimonas chloritidismutans]NKQ10238.1 hypothetical protein [Pseudomonas sp. SST3]HCI3504192.1 hypothetical protein [Pseudomonas aeruginosa]